MAEGVSNSSLYQKEAMIFLNYLARPETQERLFQEESKHSSFGTPYSNKNLAEKLRGTDAFVFVEQATNSYSSPFAINPVPESKNVGKNESLRAAVNSILSGTSSNDAAETLINTFNSTPATEIPGEEQLEELEGIIDSGILPQ